MNETTPSIICVLAGDSSADPGAKTKYGHLLAALRRRFQVVETMDASLKGVDRLFNAARVIHLNRDRWRERFYKNVPAFVRRSRRLARRLAGPRPPATVVLQIGVLFDASWGANPLPSIIYTDYTARLSARRPHAGRSPFSTRTMREWIDLEGDAFRRATCVCTRSDLVRDSVVEAYAIPPEKVVTIGGGVNLDSMPEIEAPRQTPATPTTLFLGKDFYRKGGDILLRAFARIREKHPQAKLLLLTNGPIPDALPKEGVEVILPTWDRQKITALYRRADLFVLPSRLETWGDVLLEAMAFGLPCIGVSGDAMEEIIVDGETGAIVPPEDEGALARALADLLRSPERRRQLGAAGRRRANTYFTWTAVVDRLAPVVERAARSHP